MMGEGGGKEQQVRQTRSLEIHSRSCSRARGFSFSFLFDVSQHKLKHIRLSAQSAATSHALRERERERRKKKTQTSQRTYIQTVLRCIPLMANVEYSSIDDFIVPKNEKKKKKTWLLFGPFPLYSQFSTFCFSLVRFVQF